MSNASPTDDKAPGGSEVLRQPVLAARGIDSIPLEPQAGVLAGDVMTLRLAAEAVEATTGRMMKVPEIAAEVPELFKGLAMVTFNPGTRVVSAEIDTGVFKWADGAKEALIRVRASGDYKQGILLPLARVAYIDGRAVSSGVVELKNGQRVRVWFANADSHQRPTRYGLVETALQLMAKFDAANGMMARRNTPAVDVKWQSGLPEIVSANRGIIDGATFSMRFALDYTGGRAVVRTRMRLRGGSSGPVDTTPVVTFGEDGPVMYRLSEEDGGLPFAVSQSEPEAWLEPGQRLNFASPDFMPAEPDMPLG